MTTSRIKRNETGERELVQNISAEELEAAAETRAQAPQGRRESRQAESSLDLAALLEVGQKTADGVSRIERRVERVHSSVDELEGRVHGLEADREAHLERLLEVVKPYAALEPRVASLEADRSATWAHRAHTAISGSFVGRHVLKPVDLVFDVAGKPAIIGYAAYRAGKALYGYVRGGAEGAIEGVLDD